MMQEFNSVTPKEGRKMIKSDGVLFLPNWDITDALVFNTITKKLRTEEKKKRALYCMKYSENHVSLVILSSKRGSRASYSQTNDFELMGNLIVKRLEDTPNEEVVELKVEIACLTLATTKKEKKFIQDL